MIEMLVATHRRSHILIVQSSLPVTSHFPSLWKHTAVILLLCPSNTTSCRIYERRTGDRQADCDHRCGGGARDFIDVDFLVYGSGEEPFAGWNEGHSAQKGLRKLTRARLPSG